MFFRYDLFLKNKINTEINTNSFIELYICLVKNTSYFTHCVFFDSNILNFCLGVIDSFGGGRHIVSEVKIYGRERFRVVVIEAFLYVTVIIYYVRNNRPVLSVRRLHF